MLDRNGNGVVDDGSELFGSATTLADGSLARHGFEALAELDRLAAGGNENGFIDAGDAAYAELALWHDVDRSGTSEPHELFPLSNAGIETISLAFGFDPFVDHWGNALTLWSTVELSNGETRRAVDVFFARP